MIAKVAKEYGAEVLKRPKELADDFTGTGVVVEHALSIYSEYEFACTIYATAPMLKEEFLKEGLKRLKNSDAINAFSVTTMPFPVQRTFKIVDDRCQMFTPEFYNTRSQDLEEAYQDAGQFYWKRLGVDNKDIMFSSESIPIILPRHLVQDIDTLEDFKRAELMYKVLNEDTISV
jgi:pseudaminic acid cytidylyltransferase